MTEMKLIDDCFVHDKDRIRHDDAIALLRARLAPVVSHENIALKDALGRYTATEITAPRNVPATDNAAVDGFAFYQPDGAENGGDFNIISRIAAGDMPSMAITAGNAARIFTGAPMPKGANSVAMQEDCLISDDHKKVRIPNGLKQGANRRKAGEDMQQGQIAVPQCHKIRPQDIAAFASFGLHKIPVQKKLRVALFSTGSEIIEPDQPHSPEKIYDANRHMLKSLLSAYPIALSDLGIIPDNADLLKTTIAKAAQNHDVIITSGGASKGEEDHILASLDALGKRHLWQLAVKPGRPMMFGQIGDCVHLGLPGNPVAAFVCFALYARVALITLGGGTYTEPQRYPLKAAFETAKKKQDRREFYRGWVALDETGTASAVKFARDGSGLISGLREATGLIEIPEEVRSVPKGSLVNFIPFSELGILS